MTLNKISTTNSNQQKLHFLTTNSHTTQDYAQIPKPIRSYESMPESKYAKINALKNVISEIQYIK